MSAPKLADKVTRTASQVRIHHDRSTVHDIAAHWFERQAGHCYSTRCGLILTAPDGAIRTTHDADCDDCTGGR